MSIKEEAVKLHDKGYNCAQSVAAACGKYTGLDEKTALAVSGGFGGGVRCGEICGAVSGAVMAIGLTNPYVDGADIEARNKIALLTKECTKRFKEQFGCIRCVELKQSGHSCDELIAFGAELAEDIILKNQDKQEN